MASYHIHSKIKYLHCGPQAPQHSAIYLPQWLLAHYPAFSFSPRHAHTPGPLHWLLHPHLVSAESLRGRPSFAQVLVFQRAAFANTSQPQPGFSFLLQSVHLPRQCGICPLSPPTALVQEGRSPVHSCSLHPLQNLTRQISAAEEPRRHLQGTQRFVQACRRGSMNAIPLGHCHPLLTPVCPGVSLTGPHASSLGCPHFLSPSSTLSFPSDPSHLAVDLRV